jgi:hypothetical protein
LILVLGWTQQYAAKDSLTLLTDISMTGDALCTTWTSYKRGIGTTMACARKEVKQGKAGVRYLATVLWVRYSPPLGRLQYQQHVGWSPYIAPPKMMTVDVYFSL